MTKPMKWRLGMKLGHVMGPNGENTSKAYLSWAAVRLGEPKTSGQERVPVEDLEGPGEVRVVVYSDPGQMLEPMTLDAHEARLQEALGALPADCTVVRVPFDQVAYAAWRVKHRADDNHVSRAQWANELVL